MPQDTNIGSGKTEGKSGIFAWCLFDWAMSAYNTVIGTFVFAVYFQRGIHGDEIAGSAMWSAAIGWAGLAVAILSPILGAIADQGGRRKPWLGLFVATTLIASSLLWFAEPSPNFIVMALGLVIVGTIAFELANVFYNAMLPGLAPPKYLGRISGWGWGLGYIGGLTCLGLALIGLVQAETPWFGLSQDGAENIRATGPLVAIWFGLFALPLFFLTPDAKGQGKPLGRAISDGLKTLWQTLLDMGNHKNIVIFLIASTLTRDGLATLFAVGGLYAAGTFQMDFDQIILFAIGLNVSAGLGATVFAFLDDGIGSRRTILIALAGLIIVGIPILFISDASVFIGLALALGLFVGPAQAASRSLMARLAPAGKETEMFGLYALTGKSVAPLGLFAFSILTTAFNSQRAGMASILCFWALGALLMLFVREKPPK